MSRPRFLRIILWLSKITLRSRIPPLPRMFASEYTALDKDSERVMTRYGIRSPSGLKIAMRKHGVDNVDDLAVQLQHHEARRQWKKRFQAGVRRLVGGTIQHPHQKEIRRAVGKKGADREVIKERIRRLKN